MTNATQALAGSGFELDEVGLGLRSFAKILFLKLVAARMKTARQQIAVMQS